jgi:hypothetical protein
MSHLVHRELRSLFDEDIATILPIGILLFVTACCDFGLGHLISLDQISAITLAGWVLDTLHFGFMGGIKVHLACVDDLGFFLHVESLLGVFVLSSSVFIVILLVVGRAHMLGVGVPNKTISHPGFFSRGVTSQKWSVRIT